MSNSFGSPLELFKVSVRPLLITSTIVATAAIIFQEEYTGTAHSVARISLLVLLLLLTLDVQIDVFLSLRKRASFPGPSSIVRVLLAMAAFFFFSDSFRFGAKGRVAAVFSLGALMFMVIFDYLQGVSPTPFPRSSNYGLTRDEQIDRIFHELRILREQYMREPRFNKEVSEIRALLNEKIGKTSEFTDQDKALLVDAIRKQITSNLTDEFVKALDDRYGTVAIKATRHESLLANFDLLRQRLFEEVGALRRRASLNLGIGSVTTFGAMAFLASIVLKVTPEYHSTAAVLSYYVPRITFVIFIEVFAFFFLRLYKVSLDDIKFYQNELTNVESKLIALRASLDEAGKQTFANVLEELAGTERNFVLKKGETTVELERRKLDAVEEHAVLEQAAKFMEKLRAKA